MNRINWLFLGILFFLFSLKSYSGIHLEPWLGYAVSGGDDNTEVTGPAAGLRLGFSLPLGVEFGGEYFVSGQNLKVDGDDTEVDYEQDGYGVFLGFNPPVLPLRFYTTYFIESEVGLEPSIGIPGLFTIDGYSNGSGYKAGIGFTGLPFLSINLEYQSIVYDSVEINGTEFDLTSGGEYNTVLATVSIPLP